MYKVLVTTSGTGSRLGELTKYTNKALVRIGKKPAISYIVEKYPDEVELVITLGYLGGQVREFLTMAYPKKKFTFVTVDTYEGPGSSLGYSMLCAKNQLQCPFIFHAVDTIVTEPVPEPTENWNAGFKGPDATPYTSFTVADNRILKMARKGAAQFDYLHIGLVGIHDYTAFWNALADAYTAEKDNKELNDVLAIAKMVDSGILFRPQEFKTWLDTGNPESLAKTRAAIGEEFANLDKKDEDIFFINGAVVKFFADETIVRDRVARAKNLAGLVPQLQASGKNFYCYSFVEGELLPRVADREIFSGYLQWLKQNLWKDVSAVAPEKFKEVCRDFYLIKTQKRIEKMHAAEGMTDRSQTINGEQVPAIAEMLRSIDINWLVGGVQSQFHGDLVLDNAIKTKDGFCLLDWRQNFGGLLEAGDRYYDFAKINHNLTVNHDIVHQNRFSVQETGEVVTCTIERKENLIECEKAFLDFLAREKLDIKKVKVLTALVWLNMSPLHHAPFNRFLYYFGKVNLWQALNNK